MKRLPKAIQIFFTDDRNGKELAHDYYLNATWVSELCDQYGALRVGEYIHRSVEAKRKWGVADRSSKTKKRKPKYPSLEEFEFGV